MKQRSPSYVFTANKAATSDMKQIKTIRQAIRHLNATNRKLAEFTGSQPDIYRVKLVPKLGEDNPNAWLYEGHNMYVLMEDAKQLDVYVTRRYD